MSKSPNILIVMTDHQRAETALPEHPAITPNLDRVVEEGVVFTNTFCSGPHCCPARATFFSGLYPSGHGVWNNISNSQALSTGLKPGVRLWSEDLAEAGYDLRWFGKWHVSIEESPKDRGWTEHIVSGCKGGTYDEFWDKIYRPLDEKPEPSERGEGEILRPGYGVYKLYGARDERPSHDDDVVEQAAAFLSQAAPKEKPWCMFVGLIGPHDPYMAPQRFIDMIDLDDVPLPPSYADEMADKPRIYQRMREQIWNQLSEREVREGIRHFWAYCGYLDELFGKLLDALDKTGQADNTLVLYTSDHGDYVGEHGLFSKGIPCFSGAYHVPNVMRWPAGVSGRGARCDELVSQADFAPTFLDMASIKTDRHFTGKSLLPLLRHDKEAHGHEELHTQCNGLELYFTQRSVRTKEFKYVFNGFDRDELYDLRNDPREMTNVADDSKYADIKRDLVGRMWRFAYEEGDGAISKYITVGLAPYGPAEAFRTPR